MLKKEIDELVRKGIEFLTSEKGKLELKKALQKAKETSKKYEEAQYIDPKKLTEPYFCSSDPRLTTSGQSGFLFKFIKHLITKAEISIIKLGETSVSKLL